MFLGYQINYLCFDPPNHKNLVFQSIGGEKFVFLAYLDNRQSNSNSISSLNFQQMYGRCTSCFLAIRSTVYVLTPQNPKTEFCKAYLVKKLFFLRILITGSPIPFLPKTFNRCIGGGCNIYLQSAQRCTICPPKTQKLSFTKPAS